MIRSAFVMILLGALSSAAVADVTGGPPGWKYDEGLSLELTRKAQRASFAGGTLPATVEVEAFVAPSGGSLFVTRAEATIPADRRDAAATHALLELVNVARRQGAAQIVASSQRADAASKQLEAAITWRDPSAGLLEISRTIVVADARRVVAVTGECMLPIAAAKDVEAVCAAALTTLDAGIPLANRVVLSIVDAPAETTLPPIATTPPTIAGATTTSPPTSGPRMGEQPSMGDGAGSPMAPMTISPAKREIDRRPLYLGGGIVVLAALFWWNRRRRDLFDREDGVTPAKPEPQATSGDDDADDLQAAARGDAPKDES